MTSRDKLYAGLASVAVVAVLMLGFLALGSPEAQRSIAADEKRVQDLRHLEQSIKMANQVPRAPEVTGYATVTDPKTRKPYEVVRESDTNYQLCATFENEKKDEFDAFWSHPRGRHCYALSIGRTR